jgi:hypothetical protein
MIILMAPCHVAVLIICQPCPFIFVAASRCRLFVQRRAMMTLYTRPSDFAARAFHAAAAQNTFMLFF